MSDINIVFTRVDNRLVHGQVGNVWVTASGANLILVVDDEKLIVKGIRFSLEQEGMEVDCAYDGEEALEYAKACEYDLSNAGKGYLPRFSLSGKATYQSDITRLPVEIPGIDVETAPKDQYQVMLELKQNIWDGGEIRSRKEQVKASSDVTGRN